MGLIDDHDNAYDKARGCRVYAPKQGVDQSEAVYHATRSGGTSAACGAEWGRLYDKMKALGLKSVRHAHLFPEEGKQMTTIDISPEAVERLACILEGRGGFVKDSTITATLRALSAAPTKLQQGQPYRYIGKDMKTILARDLEDQRDAALAALTQSRAETAAAYERAAQKVLSDQWPTYGDAKRISGSIRALATAEQSSAIAAVIAEAEARGMRKAAEAVPNLGWEAFVADDAPSYLSDWQRGLVAGQKAMRDAILAAIPQGDTTND